MCEPSQWRTDVTHLSTKLPNVFSVTHTHTQTLELTHSHNIHLLTVSTQHTRTIHTHSARDILFLDLSLIVCVYFVQVCPCE